ASILKAVDETRMFEKIGGSPALAGHDLHIIGFPSASGTTAHPSLHCRPVAPLPSKRLSLTRLFASLRLLRMVLKLKPDYFIITTHELLFTALWCKFLTGCKVLYDVQESYYRTIRYTTAFPVGVRTVLAAWVRLKERLLHPI